MTWGDYDNDGDLDIYVANDSTENFFYQNNGDGTFEEIGFMIGLAVSEDGNVKNGMGTAFGDLDNDGWLDLIVTNYADQTNALYRNDGDGFFTDITRMSRIGEISFPYLGWATFFFDYDNDGLQDLYIANGHLHENLAVLGQEGTYPQPDLIFKNNGDRSFTEIADQLGDAYLPTVSRGAAWADYDLDGDVDMVVTNSNGRPRLLRNDGGNENHWISFSVAGIAIGTRITVQTSNMLQTKEVGNQSGYLSQSEKHLHFGIGSAKQVDLITVRYPNGKMQQLSQVKTNQTLQVSGD